MWGILAGDGGFDILCADAVNNRDRLHLDTLTVAALEELSVRYARLLESSQPAVGLQALGRDLYGWLDADGGHLTALLRQAPRPFRFEVCASDLHPSAAEWALLRALWELLADGKGFLADDVGLGFSPVRRLGQRVDTPPLNPHRLGLVFMAASPQGVVELDYEAEETALMKAVGSTQLDLLVEESGNPGELGDRLKEHAAMQALHLSCHGHNARPPGSKPDAPSKPVLMLETLEGRGLPTDADQLIRTLRARPPRFLFLSACFTTTAGGDKRNGLPGAAGHKDSSASVRSAVVCSLSEALVNAGLPVVLGWDGSVADVAATAFAVQLIGGSAQPARLGLLLSGRADG
jgi:hypothetical protein